MLMMGEIEIMNNCINKKEIYINEYKENLTDKDYF